MPEPIIEVSDAIAGMVILISVLSALYARWAASEAKRANKLTLHPHKKMIFDAFMKLKMHMTARGLRPDIKEVSKFYQLSDESNLYLSEQLSGKVKEYYSYCFKAADLAKLGNDLYPNEDPVIHDSVANARKLAPIIEAELRNIIKKYAADR